VGSGVLVRVLVGVGSGVLVGGTGVSMGGIGVLVRMISGGSGVLVRVSVFVGIGVLVRVSVFVVSNVGIRNGVDVSMGECRTVRTRVDKTVGVY
jgi:hypothetical protein